MKPILLCILDGVGMRKEEYGNAFLQAETPNFDKLWKQYPHSYLEASGTFVGLPEGQMGNSEVGHLNIGAGRVVYQPLQFITEKIKNQTFFENEKILEIIHHVQKNHSRLQIFGLLSDGGIHSHIEHLMAVIDLCKKENMRDVYFHIFTDGRDTLTDVAQTYLEQLEQKIKETGIGKIATISGRYYAMDRDNRYDRIEKAYKAIVKGEGEQFSTYQEVIAHNYENGVTDEFIVPAVLDAEGCIKKKDGLFVFNYRPDRLRELFSALTNPKFKGFKRKFISNLKLITMMPVSSEVIHESAFSLERLDNTLGEYISNQGLKQLRIAETEKYAHVTYFFDGGEEKELEGCSRILIPSPKVASYDLSPEMRAEEITDTVLSKLEEDSYDFIVLNYANGDMLGHTGNLEATIQSIETVDVCIGKLAQKIKEKNGILVITADHGNCEIMLDENNNKITTHTTSLVPFIITKKGLILKNGILADIAPTILSLFSLKIPDEMTGHNLIQKKNKHNFRFDFILISCLFLLSLIGIYGYRLVYFYKKYHSSDIQQEVTLYQKIITGVPFATSGSGLYYNQDGYLYKGKVENNYIYYSNRYFRIVRINSDGSIVLVTDDNVTSLVWGYQNNDYRDSYIRDWLNDRGVEHTGIFYNSLDNPDLYLQNGTYCIDAVDGENITCENQVTDKVGLLSIQEYKDAFGNESYLNIGKYWWTSNPSIDGQIWYVFREGGIHSKSNTQDDYYAYGVRPVITLKPDVKFISGNGTYESPYQFTQPESTLQIGSYVTFDQSLWRVIHTTENATQMIKEDSLKIDDQTIKRIFSNNSNQYNPNDPGSLAYYLNHTYYQSLEKKELLVESLWYNGAYGEDYNYKNCYTNTVSAKVGLINIGNFYDDDVPFVTMTGIHDDLVYFVSEQGMLTTADIESEFTVRPVISLTKSVTIISGDGTKENPFVIG